MILMAALATQVVTKCLHIWKHRTDFKEKGERVRGGQRDGGVGIGLEGFSLKGLDETRGVVEG